NGITVNVRPKLFLFQLAQNLGALLTILEPFDLHRDHACGIARDGELRVDGPGERGVTSWPVTSDPAVVDYGHGALERFADGIRSADVGGHVFVAVLTAEQRAIESIDHNKRVPYRLKTVLRKAGRRKQPENFVRDLVIRTLVDKRIKELGPGSYDASIKDVRPSTSWSSIINAR